MSFKEIYIVEQQTREVKRNIKIMSVRLKILIFNIKNIIVADADTNMNNFPSLSPISD